MSKELEELKTLVKQESDKLICETHPECCRLRDENYEHFQRLVMDFIFREEEPVSVQTAIAELEQELEHS